MYICQILTNGEEIASLELERWKPRVEDFGFHLDSIPNESKVLITCYHSQNWVSVRPINPKVNQEYLKMIQDINLHCLLGKFFLSFFLFLTFRIFKRSTVQSKNRILLISLCLSQYCNP